MNNQLRHVATLMLVATIGYVGNAAAVPFVLTNGPGDGRVTVGVDGFGAFGSSVGADSINATYDPVGAGLAAGTTFESGIAIRFGASGARSFLTSGDIGGSGGLTNPALSGSSTSASSAFIVGGLSFALTQSLTTLSAGSLLTQTYVITNPGAVISDFELVRYLDGDLLFNGTLADGGGRLFIGPDEVLFETDSATGSSVATTFVGITGTGGLIPGVGRYEIDSFAGLRGRIIAGTALDGIISGDGGDADEFIDAGPGYDVTLALRNIFSLSAGGSATYTTRTIFGSGTPTGGGGLRVPEPTSLSLVALTLAGLGFNRRRRLHG